ncbi:large subunit GTPase 1 homolog isoform X2 [Condylostylus longicornis]|uniref:large subunit GTPase 1 homolog isoform X2 n=1 Tax=Condylostylus longicornis TaxID=2530218 RepID=UPI00244DD40C|nr:large subunit GTPase 1 homolog isoform X2 [Condylostylus longicornis]
MGKKNKSGNNSLGRTLIKDRFGKKHRTLDNGSMLHTADLQDGYDWGRLNLQSVTEESSFEDFLRTAELAGTEFQAEKLNIKFINPKSNVGLLTNQEKASMKEKHIAHKKALQIPRRPPWSKDMTAEELKERENASFLEWRKSLSLLQENEGVLMTPYEKNLDFWRQLWRVVERSDVILQIVDARNPLMFRNEDLEKYVKEVDNNKMNIILINKSDFLTKEQRESWATYFDSIGLKAAFFSATAATESQNKELDKVIEENEDLDSENEEKSNFKEVVAENLENCGNENQTNEDKSNSQSEDNKLFENKIEDQLTLVETKLKEAGICEVNSPKLLSREELIQLFKTIYKGPKVTEGVTTIGMVGYPNVGKSSTINALLTEKKVSVSSTPGKTKHFQTLYLDHDILLCDCPGLVMPSFVFTKAEMILCGILPIDQMRDHVPPINLLLTEIPAHVLEDKYGILIAKPLEGEDSERPPFSEELLLAHAYNRGFMTANGQPDQSRSARYILKDYVNGKLLYCHAPPTINQNEFHIFPPRTKKEIIENKLPEQQQRAMRINKITTAKELDDKFFASNTGAAYIKGRSNFPHIRTTSSDVNSECSGSIAGSQQSLNSLQFGEKPWRNVKKEKREKLRKKYAYLDKH